MNIIGLEQVRQYMSAPTESLHIKPASTFLDKVLAKIEGSDDDIVGDRMPWAKTWNLFRARPKEVTIITGYNGHFKSMLLNYIILDLLRFRKCLIVSPEMPPDETLYRMTLQAAGNGEPTPQFATKFANWTDNRLWLYEQTDSMKTDVLKAVIRYASAELNIRHVVVDSLMMCGTDGFDSHGSLKQEKEFVRDLTSLAKDHNIHIWLVAHARKAGERDERKPPGKQDVSGSGHITNLASNVFSCWHNIVRKEKLENVELSEDERKKIESAPEFLLTCCKQRNGAWQGKVAFWMNSGLQFVENYGDRATIRDYSE